MAPARPEAAAAGHSSDRYQWIALSNTTLGTLLAAINSSILLIALPDILDGIKLNPLQPGNAGYLLWMMTGFLIVTAVLVVTFGRLGDRFGRVRMYNLGFACFTVCSILLSVTWMTGTDAARWLIGGRIGQGVGGAFLMANSTAILTDVFPASQRGTASGVNSIAAVAGSFIGLLLGGLLAPHNWHLVFVVPAAAGVIGTVWACLTLRETSTRRPVKIDWRGNATFAVGLIAVLVALTYGIQPYGGHSTGWTSPWVLAGLIGGAVALAVLVVIERRVTEPLFRLSLTRQAVPAATAAVSRLPALGVLFAAFLGYHPMRSLLGPLTGHLPAANVTVLTGPGFFSQLITQPFHDGLVAAFWFAVAASVIATAASVFTGKRTSERTGGEPASATGPPAVTREPPPAAEAEAETVIAGVVTGPDGAPAAGAAVTALDAANAVAGAAVTEADGGYRLPVPGPGHYVVVAAALRSQTVALHAQAGADAAVVLRIGERP